MLDEGGVVDDMVGGVGVGSAGEGIRGCDMSRYKVEVAAAYTDEREHLLATKRDMQWAVVQVDHYPHRGQHGETTMTSLIALFMFERDAHAFATYCVHGGAN